MPGSAKPRIVFLIMSAVSRADTVGQLAHALAPHTALVHHDFSQTPSFPLRLPNVVFVPEPRRTGWACFGFVDGIFHSLNYALTHLDFDYLQLLSPTCLPIKPLAQFERCVASGVQAHFDCVDLLADRDALMSVGYRGFTAQHTPLHRLARRAADLYFGPDCGRRDEAGIWLRTGGRTDPRAWPARMLMALLSRPAIGRHPFGPGLRPYYGTAWFGARREVVQALVESFQRPGIRDYFSGLRIAEEFLFPTLLMPLVQRRGPMNHVIQRYDGAHVGLFEDRDLPLLRQSEAFFARKFADDPAASLRLRVLHELVGAGVQASDPAAGFRWPALDERRAPRGRPLTARAAPTSAAPAAPLR